MNSNVYCNVLCLDDEEEEEEDVGEEGKKKGKKQTRGGKGVVRPKKKIQEVQGISLSRASRGKRKYMTVITGLSTYGKTVESVLLKIGFK